MGEDGCWKGRVGTLSVTRLCTGRYRISVGDEGVVVTRCGVKWGLGAKPPSSLWEELCRICKDTNDAGKVLEVMLVLELRAISEGRT